MDGVLGKWNMKRGGEEKPFDFFFNIQYIHGNIYGTCTYIDIFINLFHTKLGS